MKGSSLGSDAGKKDQKIQLLKESNSDIFTGKDEQ